MSEPQLPKFQDQSKKLMTRWTAAENGIRTLEAIAEHSVVIEELRIALGFKDSKTAMSWVFEQLEQSQDLKHAILKLLDD